MVPDALRSPFHYARNSMLLINKNMEHLSCHFSLDKCLESGIVKI